MADRFGTVTPQESAAINPAVIECAKFACVLSTIASIVPGVRPGVEAYSQAATGLPSRASATMV
jgi:hypothetical protein